MSYSQINGTCLIDDTCCGTDCCDPALECCVGGVCIAIPTNCDECEEEIDFVLCECNPKDNGCTGGDYACGDGCCGGDELCISCPGGIPNCQPI